MTESEDLSPEVYAELLKKLESDRTNLQSWFDVESYQVKLFKRRMAIAVKDAQHISRWGGGECDFLVEMLINACKEAGLYRQRTPREGYRKARVPHKVRKQVFERDAYRCKHCGTHKDLCIDHIYPEFLGGPSTYENLQVLCAPCNVKKGTSIPEGASSDQHH